MSSPHVISNVRQPENTRVLGLALAQFLFARDWQTAGALLERFPCLLGQSARSLLAELVVEAHQRGDERDTLILHQHLEFLDQVRLGGGETGA
jgi:hypothetical protein